MTTKELKAHRRAICEALIEGKKCQVVDHKHNWIDLHPSSIAAGLFSDKHNPDTIRIKPEPRKCWIGWRGPEYVPVFAEDEESFRYMSNKYPAYNWQLVEEPE